MEEKTFQLLSYQATRCTKQFWGGFLQTLRCREDRSSVSSHSDARHGSGRLKGRISYTFRVKSVYM